MLSASPDTVCVFGLGRVGLPTAVVWADAGYAVVGVDPSASVRDAVTGGVSGVDEPGLSVALARVLESGRLRVSTKPSPCAVVVIAVPTPLDARNGADLGALWLALDAVVEVIDPTGLVLIESTVPVGTTDAAAHQLRQHRPLVHVAHTPERVLPGAALHEIVHNERVVGGVDDLSTLAARLHLERVVRGRIRPTDARTAELVKLTENTSRDVQIALANEIDAVAHANGVDPWRVRHLVNSHPRVQLLRPGPGVGGPCIPVDPWFAIGAHEAPLLRAARRVNDARPAEIIARVTAVVSDSGSTVGVLGLTYKADVAELRGSPALQVALGLATRHPVVAHDPLVAVPAPLAGGSVAEVAACDVVVGLVAHTAYAQSDVIARLHTASLIDVAGLLAPPEAQR